MNIKTIGKFIEVDIKKPMDVQPEYDFVRVRKDYFDRAEKMGYNVLIRTPNGERVMSPDQVKNYNVEKEIFLYPNNPMHLYNVVVPHKEKKPNDYYIFL